MPDRLQRARDDLRAFSKLAGRPLERWQVAALRLDTPITAIVAPRQSGKSRSLGVLAAWWAYRRHRSRILIVSAGDEASRRLLREIRVLVTGSDLLRGSVVDETAGLVTLSNGSEIRSVPASEKQIRGWSVDLLLCDEAALISDDLLLGAAFPTTAARPEARIVLASSATVASGALFDHVMRGRQGDQHVTAHSWKLTDCTWISPSVIEAARSSMTEARFRAEYEGEFASGADAVFPRELIDRATADVEIPGLDGLTGVGLLGGVDWGATTDRSAIVALGQLERPRGVLLVVAAHAWPSGHPLDGSPDSVISTIAEWARSFGLLTAEANGLGLPLAQELQRRVSARWGGSPRPPRVELQTSSSEMKSALYSSLRLALEQGRLILPASAVELRRELLLLRVQLLPGGAERIEADRGHDDLADALMLAAGPYRYRSGEWRSRLRDVLEESSLETGVEPGDDWTTTGAGLPVPRTPKLRVTTPESRATSTPYHPWGRRRPRPREADRRDRDGSRERPFLYVPSTALRPVPRSNEKKGKKNDA